MAFPQSVIDAAWDRAGGHCECWRTSHPNHEGRDCKKRLVKANRGRLAPGPGRWEAHHVRRDGPDTLANCEILCWDCHSLVTSAQAS